MKTTIRLLAADLHYPPELQVYTAASGAVATLAARYLVIERSDGLHGIGEIRANITFLSKLPEAQVSTAIRELVNLIDWSTAPEIILEQLTQTYSGHPALARAAVENALLDAVARRDNRSVAEVLGGSFQTRTKTNQCLFWGPEENLDRLAERYVVEGFQDLKVRIGVGNIDQDCARLGRLRERYGDTIKLAADANGAWDIQSALHNLRRLEEFRLDYLEQPTKAGDWQAFSRAIESTEIPLMLDEGLTSQADIDQIAALSGKALAHLKIAKLGSARALVAAARTLSELGVGVMIGQMNEGAMATAIATHCVMAAKPRWAELYGCYGLLDDACSGLSYREGHVQLPPSPGVGVTFDPARTSTLWIETH